MNNPSEIAKQKEELLQKRISGLRFVIDKASRLNRLLGNEDYNLFISEVKAKQKQYNNVLHKPRQIGFVTRKTINLTGNVQYQDFKYTEEDDKARIKEAQYRYDTFERVITMIQDYNEEGKRATAELKKLTETKNIPSKK